MLWKTLLIISLISFDTATAIAKGRYVPDPVAVKYRKGSFFDQDVRSKKLSPTTWQVITFGTNVTSGERLEIYTNLRIALLAMKNGFSHFSFATEKKSVMCRNRLMGTNPAVPYMTGVATFSKSGKNGLVDASSYVAKHTNYLAVDAPESEKSAVFSDWSGRCQSR